MNVSCMSEFILDIEDVKDSIRTDVEASHRRTTYVVLQTP